MAERTWLLARALAWLVLALTAGDTGEGRW